MNAKKALSLDEMLPLKGASHADVRHYGVDTPMRYSECYASLGDGRKVRLCDSRQFVGWAGSADNKHLIFETSAGRVLIDAAADLVDHPADCELLKVVARDGAILA